MQKQTKSSFFILIAILLSLSGFNQTNPKCRNFKEILCFGGMVLTGGFIIHKLAKMGYFDKSPDQVVNDAYSALNKGIKLSEIDILDRKFNILNLSESKKRKKIDRIKEGILFQLNPAISQFSSVNHYLDSLRSTISDLKTSRNEVSHCLKKTNSRENDLNNLLVTINEILPKIEFLYAYVLAHQSYFNLYKIYKSLDSEYEKELRLVSSPRIAYQDFRWIVRNMGCKIDPKYPFTSYINKLNVQINSLNSSISGVAYKYNNLLSFAKDIKAKLNTIYDNAISDEEYSKEARDIENEKYKKEQHELQEKEFALKQQVELEKLALKERETSAREREAAAREYELYLKQIKDDRDRR